MTLSQPTEAMHRKGTIISVCRIGLHDLPEVLSCGLQDFLEKPSHYFFALLIYPVIGLALFLWASQGNAWHLIYPLLAGFALLGPVAALGLYEISRRRELGLEIEWQHWFSALRSPAFPTIAMLALWLLVLFFAWLLTAEWLYLSLFGSSSAPSGPLALLVDVIGTGSGWRLLILGHLIGFCFALTALGTTVVAFPLLLDQHVSLKTAVAVSLLATLKNPLPVLGWGVCVALILILGSLPALAGLIVALPVLGHTTWHLYRRLVRIDGSVAIDLKG